MKKNKSITIEEAEWLHVIQNAIKKYHWQKKSFGSYRCRVKNREFILKESDIGWICYSDDEVYQYRLETFKDFEDFMKTHIDQDYNIYKVLDM